MTKSTRNRIFTRSKSHREEGTCAEFFRVSFAVHAYSRSDSEQKEPLLSKCRAVNRCTGSSELNVVIALHSARTCRWSQKAEKMCDEEEVLEESSGGWNGLEIKPWSCLIDWFFDDLKGRSGRQCREMTCFSINARFRLGVGKCTLRHRKRKKRDRNVDWSSLEPTTHLVGSPRFEQFASGRGWTLTPCGITEL